MVLIWDLLWVGLEVKVGSSMKDYLDPLAHIMVLLILQPGKNVRVHRRAHERATCAFNPCAIISREACYMIDLAQRVM